MFEPLPLLPPDSRNRMADKTARTRKVSALYFHHLKTRTTGASFYAKGSCVLGRVPYQSAPSCFPVPAFSSFH